MEFAPVQRDDLTTFDAYLSSLSAPIDSFQEHAIIESAVHRISIDGTEVGSFAIHDGGLLTQFHMVGAARRFGQDAMARILDDYSVAAAYAPTSDNFMLSHVTDREHVLKRQAYMFAEGVPGPVDASPPWHYRLAEPADVGAITEMSGDFLDRLDVRVAEGEVHVGWAGNELVAVGIAEPGRLLAGYASIGMFTSEAHRKRGVGAATIRYLRNDCHARGVTPIAGCWYYNANSKRTLEAAGMVAIARLLRIEFIQT
jgi:GNAT superfamily N-acetyltransferase